MSLLTCWRAINPQHPRYDGGSAFCDVCEADRATIKAPVIVPKLLLPRDDHPDGARPPGTVG